ncbi:MAG TPA: NAD-dependent malic enzyme [Psychromonas hadalis]|nr:NAD-dependent malic enzyme [Psychromonas hadalis]
MKNFKRPLYIPFAGPVLLETPLLNKGSAFSQEERIRFNIEGLVPAAIESIDEQTARAYEQFQEFTSDIERHIYLRNIQDINETLFYRLIQQHINEMLPLIYTPTVGQACEQFSHRYRRARGLFISYPNRDHIDDILNNATHHNVKVIVLTDGQRILGLGDQGIGGMGIPIGKLSLYTSCGGISPAYTLPITLDVGTNNQELLDDPLYLGWKNKRITGAQYTEFVDLFMTAVKIRWPEAIIQFEDFAQQNAIPLLERYQDEYRCFNDDVQGTASVAVGSLLAACKSAGSKISEQTIGFLGAGAAGCGIAEAIVAHMVAEGLTDQQARSRIFLLNSRGLILDSTEGLYNFQEKLVQPAELVKEWECEEEGKINLFDVVHNCKPTVLIGVSGVPGLFGEKIIREMYNYCSKPIVLPLSNPTSKVEATPVDILTWTEGNALVATGSPFDPVELNGQTHIISQCNNVYIFPGVGLGVLASKATNISNEMMMAASIALADYSPLANTGTGPLLPKFDDIQRISRHIAFAVAKQAIAQNFANPISDKRLKRRIEENFWLPEYRDYRRSSF